MRGEGISSYEVEKTVSDLRDQKKLKICEWIPSTYSINLCNKAHDKDLGVDASLLINSASMSYVFKWIG